MGHIKVVVFPEAFGEDKVGLTDVVKLDSVDFGKCGKGLGLLDKVIADFGRGGAEELIVGYKGAVRFSPAGFALSTDGIPMRMFKGFLVAGTVERPEPGDGGQLVGFRPTCNFLNLLGGAINNERIDACVGPLLKMFGGKVGVISVNPETNGGICRGGCADGGGGEADAAPLFGGVDGDLTGG